MTGKLHIVHIITGLQVGGAEMMLARLAEQLDRGRFTQEVICLGPRGPLAERLEQTGIPLTCLNLRGPLALMKGWWKIARHLRRTKPTVVQTWLYHGDFLGGLAAKLGGGRPPVAWGIHHSTLTKGSMKFATRCLVSVLAKLSRWLPDKVVSCSQSSAREHLAKGYAAHKVELIFNGCDTTKFAPNQQAREQLRRSLGIPAGAPVIGFVGRAAPVKDLPTFFKAAALTQTELPGAHFVLCGPDQATLTSEIRSAWQSLPRPEQVHFLSFRRDIENVHPAFDLLALTSVSEACPMVLIEAMACGVPGTCTDVGDAAFILARPASLAPVGDAAAISASWLGILRLPEEERAALGAAARRHVEKNFALTACVRRYEDLYVRLATRTAAAPQSSAATCLISSSLP